MSSHRNSLTQPSSSKKPRAPHVKVTLTDEIIVDSIQRHSSHCMIAEAVKAVLPKAKAVSVDLQTIRFTDPEKSLRYTYLTPRRAQVALVQFDQGIRTEPFAFRLSGGHVTRAGRKPGPPPLNKQTIRSPSGTGVPERVGGRTPPVANISARRSYGLRAFDLGIDLDAGAAQREQHSDEEPAST